MSNRPPVPQFPGINPPSTDFGAVIDGRRATLFVVEIDLSTARTFGGTGANAALQIKITGNSFFVDQASDVGSATLIFEGVQDDSGPLVRPAVFVQPGFVARIPFANIRLANTAQAGKKLRIFYGVDVDFVPSVNASVAITGNVTAIPYGYTYTASYKSITNMAANTPDTVFAAGANVNGAIVWRATFLHMNAGGNGAGFLAKNAAPATIIDGDVICGVDTYAATAANNFNSGCLQTPVFIGAGKGLFYIPQNADVQAYRSVLYSLL